MKEEQQARTYSLHGTKLQVYCSTAMAAYLDARFRLLAKGESCPEAVFFDFGAAPDPSRHTVEKPEGPSRPFYEMPEGESCYFEATDEVYLAFRDSVRALYTPRHNHVSLSTVESEPRNLFMASHLVLTILLVEIFKRRDWYSLHAAGFSKNGRAILIPGASGAGKSTLSVALLRAGFDYLGDDMLFLKRCPNGLAVRGLVEDVDVSDQTIRLFPELDFLLQRPKTEGFPKRQIRFEEVYGARAIPESRPEAIAFPRISGNRNSVIAQVDGDQALLELVPNVLLTQPRACRAHLALLADMVRQTPCYRLDTGQDFARIPTLFRDLLCSRPEEVRA